MREHEILGMAPEETSETFPDLAPAQGLSLPILTAIWIISSVLYIWASPPIALTVTIAWCEFGLMGTIYLAASVTGAVTLHDHRRILRLPSGFEGMDNLPYFSSARSAGVRRALRSRRKVRHHGPQA
jgi:hypothetical protein